MAAKQHSATKDINMEPGSRDETQEGNVQASTPKNTGEETVPNGTQCSPLLHSSPEVFSSPSRQSPALANGPSLHSNSEELDGTTTIEASCKNSSSPGSQVFEQTTSKLHKSVAVEKASNENAKFELLHLFSEENQGKTNTLQVSSKEDINNKRIWNLETNSSESSSDESTSDLNWDPQKEFMQFLWSDHEEQDFDKRLEASPSLGSRRRKRKMDMVEFMDLSEEAYAFQRSPPEDASDSEADNFSNNMYHLQKKSSIKTSEEACDGCPDDTVKAISHLIRNVPAKKVHKSVIIHEIDMGGKLKPLKTSPLSELSSEEEPSFFPCTKCNVNFKEKKHLHRHMMYHLDGNSQVRHVNVPRPFICRECGRSFRDRNSLQKHMIIHQERREKLMEEIKGLNELKDEGRSATLQCPQCVFGTNCPNTFVQHAKTHEKDKRYYCCEECNHMAVTEHELEAHLYSAHCITRKPPFAIMTKKDELKEQKLEVMKNNALVSLHCKLCSFSTSSKNLLKKHLELIHQQNFDHDVEEEKVHQYSVLDDCEDHPETKTQEAGTQLKHLNTEKQGFRKRTSWSDGLADFIRKRKTTQKARKGFNSSLSQSSSGNYVNKFSSSLRKSEEHNDVDRVGVATRLPYSGERYNDEDHGYETLFSGSLERSHALISRYKTTEPESSSGSCLLHQSEMQVDGEDFENKDLAVEPVRRKSPSKRKMSTPFHNTMDMTTEQLHEDSSDQDMSENIQESFEDPYDFSDYTSEATANFLDSSENEHNPYARSYFIRQRFSTNDDQGSSGEMFERSYDSENDSDTIQKFVVKEECIETDLSAGVSEEGVGLQSDCFADFDIPHFGVERKSCPYCPAFFESGVGLSNHVRGHLHRVGLTYDARHVVPPEQVASQDRRPRIRRKMATMRRMKKAHKSEAQAEHTCPLCGGWFDTKTGLSNHVRGHLKRIGKTVSSTSKSPLCILNEMMQDEKQSQNILQVLSKKRFLSRPFVSQKFAGSDGLFLSPAGVPVKIQHISPEPKPWSLLTAEEEDECPESKVVVRGSPSSTLVELLKKKKVGDEMDVRNHSQSARKCLSVSPAKEQSSVTPPLGAESNWVPDKSELNKKVCMHCNTSFHSAVSLSNHLRAYARRKRAALQEGTTYDCKQKKPRSRPGPKKKIFPLPHTADEIYHLTCRFCDLVFQGPLSVQEDWIKHLQRHLMNTSVPRTGAGMVEVTILPEAPPSPDGSVVSLLVSQVAS